jgi:hypothetical protein
MKIEGSGSGSISQRHGSADPDPHQNVIDPQHCFVGHACLPDRHCEDGQDPEQRRVGPHQLHAGGGGAQEQVQPLLPGLPGKTKTTDVI